MQLVSHPEAVVQYTFTHEQYTERHKKYIEQHKNKQYVEKHKKLFFANRVVYEIMWKNIVEPGRPQMTLGRMRIACWNIRLQIHNRICNTYCFSTATMVARMRLNTTLYVHCLSCLRRIKCVYYSVYRPMSC